jgi:hypothetical protein
LILKINITRANILFKMYVILTVHRR